MIAVTTYWAAARKGAADGGHSQYICIANISIVCLTTKDCIVKTIFQQHLEKCLQAIRNEGHNIQLVTRLIVLDPSVVIVRLKYPSTRKDWNQIEKTINHVFKMYGFGGIRSCIVKTDIMREYEICIVPTSFISNFIKSYLTKLINTQFNSITSFTNKTAIHEGINIKIDHEETRCDDGYYVKFKVSPTKRKETLTVDEYQTLRAIFEVNKVNIIGRFKASDGFPHLKMDACNYQFDPEGTYFQLKMTYERNSSMVIQYKRKKTLRDYFNDCHDYVVVSAFIAVEWLKTMFKTKK